MSTELIYRKPPPPKPHECVLPQGDNREGDIRQCKTCKRFWLWGEKYDELFERSYEAWLRCNAKGQHLVRKKKSTGFWWWQFDWIWVDPITQNEVVY